ncbi:Basic-leucine zipper domain [Phytophthora cactorum]|nr:Basic-leucine zipper domain [Phytophthora cactorum]
MATQRTEESTPYTTEMTPHTNARQMKLSASRRERCRINQARYRKRQRQHEEEIEKHISDLQEEIQELETQHQDMMRSAPQNKSMWVVGTEYFRLFRHGYMAPMHLVSDQVIGVVVQRVAPLHGCVNHDCSFITPTRLPPVESLTDETRLNPMQTPEDQPGQIPKEKRQHAEELDERIRQLEEEVEHLETQRHNAPTDKASGLWQPKRSSTYSSNS